WRRLAELFPNVVEVDLSAIRVCTISWLAQLPKLQKLALNAGSLDRQHMQSLSELRNLRKLKVSELLATDLNELAGLQLASLALAHCRYLTDVTVLGEHVKHLEVLKLRDAASLGDLSVVIQLPALRELKKLKLKHLDLDDLEFLALCPKLTALNFCGYADLSTLVAVPELRSLRLEIIHRGEWRTSEIDLSPLRSLTKLERLEMKSGVIRGANLPPLPRLQYLDVSTLDDLRPICDRLLPLSTLIISDYSVLVRLPKLMFLSVERRDTFRESDLTLLKSVGRSRPLCVRATIAPKPPVKSSVY
ncbi:hypothetical protein PybrP1_007170, partial [[Pythium] brassicae (nom. inval.)]